MSLRISEEIWLQKALSNLHQECELFMKLLCDNKSTISIADIPVQHDETKHVKIEKHFIKEKLDNDSFCISYNPSSQQIVDGSHQRIDSCVSKLGQIDINPPT